MFSYLGCLYSRMEQEQFKIEVLPLRKKLTCCAYRLLDDPEDVEDVIQEVFLKLWYIREELDSYNSIEALAMQTTKHLCLNRLKSFQLRQKETLNESEFISDGVTPYTELEQKDNVNQVMRIIDRLPGLQQIILRMKHVDGCEVEEIAALTGSTPDAVRMNLSRARRRVKELFFKM